MDALKILGGNPLSGTINVSGSKNAALPIMAASLLSASRSHLTRVPDLADVQTLGTVLGGFGVKVEGGCSELFLDATNLTSHEASYELVRTMRASILVLGPLLARLKKARVSLPGGCAIGARPIDQHLKGLTKMGASIKLEHGYVEAVTERLVGAEIIFDFPTVGGTENLMLAASLAKGQTVLRNAAREPEIVDLAQALRSMGAKIKGDGTSTIVIDGVDELGPCVHEVVADRIEFGTFLVAGAMAGDGLEIVGGRVDHQKALIDKLIQAGAEIAFDNAVGSITLSQPERLKGIHFKTTPYPGFPTDMQAQVMTMLCLAKGTSVVTENIFEWQRSHLTLESHIHR